MSANDPRTARLAQQIRVETHDLHIPAQASELARRCGALFRDGQYEEGMALARRVDDFASNAVAQRQVGLGLAYLGRYEEARHHLQWSTYFERDGHIRANCLANIGTTFLEEWDLKRAEEMYHQALELDPANPFGLLGYLAVACQREDISAVESAAQQLVAHCPAWRESDLIVATLVRDRSFHFLREHTAVFIREFGLTPDALALERIRKAAHQEWERRAAHMLVRSMGETAMSAELEARQEDDDTIHRPGQTGH
jgi:tetratricopeptide (TPR) repeat protein